MNICFSFFVSRTILVLGVIGIAIAIPKISPLIELIGALCFSTLGLIAPVSDFI